jgi:hypothetical protein
MSTTIANIESTKMNLYNRSVAPGQSVDMSEEEFRDLQIHVISSRTAQHGLPYEYVETWDDELIDAAWSLIMG